MVKIKKVFIDTNFWIRYFTKDNEIQYKATVDLVEKIESGKFRPFISAIVFLEINFVLSQLYDKNLKQINKCFDLIMSLRNLVIVNKTDFEKALKWHRNLKIKLPDCLIASCLPDNCVLVSWDKDFNKIKEIDSKKPSEF
ncbi:PIN domain-containing protein [Patescibacteria group bacterium]|nr:PIN domain-containing protein [Patescibacteria group bacterium]MCG2702274.1 PIN domain-containing protein [Candidatus Parcubacteria bacterium]MBU4210666.1 PIN domain-containing protein [Patescibacteria group bacterium]MBU4264712.1 PIN domain-containing protein [Patescibacteria group bacterium]MBU4390050.1 PIN domain-containing protein [Patescibacteria group bacterium]